ncbi:rac GTPase-activating protein 1-like [Pectinophora gossypiella]|uniref:rac GTPase-activating protein 1-like n=1 Tax=Pectinophora gossypiella TaxID=13191 RepID=UPI00214F4D80|nr:rac GTPase-activating protein 1-like [Pectinophora gossypiella]
MSTETSDTGASIALSLVAQFDDINRLNGVLNEGSAEECFLAFVKQMEWVRSQWASAEAEAIRLQTELDEALRSLAKWESKFAHVRKLLDSEKRERNVVLKKYNELSKLLDMARDLLFNDNRAKLNDETLQKLAFLNGTAQDHNAKLANVPELNSTGTLLSEMSYSRSEDDLDLSLASTRRSWVQRGGWNARDAQPASKKRRSSTSSATKTVELQGGKVLATATTTLTLERAPTNHDLKPPQNFQPISESSDEAPPRKSSGRSSKHAQPSDMPTPTAPPRTDTDTASDTPATPRAAPQRTPSVISAAYGGSPRARPRQHNFVAKNFYKRETCGPCGKTIKFAKVGVKCESCRAQAHPECRALLPLPCVPPGAARRTHALQEGSIADYAPSSPPMVPALLVHCINEVEKRGLAERGVYRISAVDKDVKRLKERFLRGCGSPQLGNEDIHVLCGCIKDFLRSLREPLVSTALWQDFMDAAKLSEPSDATAAIVHAVSQLPPPNRDTLAFLILHLQKVAESPECEMGVENLAKIFGPTVVGYGLVTQAAEMYTATAQMFHVMQLMLRLPADYWAQWACCGDASPAAPPRARGFFFSPADTGISRKKRNYFQ